MIFKIKKRVRNALKNLRFRLSRGNHPLFIGFYKYYYKPKPGTLDELINSYSLSLKNELTVVQIGANDGITHDPIHKYIKRDNWNGVLLEPQSYVYHKYLEPIYEKNKGINTLCAALGSKDGLSTLYRIGFSNMRWANGLSAFSKAKVEEAYTNGMVTDRCKKHRIEIPTDPNERIKSEEVKVISPSTLLKKYNIDKIDLLQIDTEGFDFEVIKLFDIASTKPAWIVYENVHFSEETIHLCRSYLENNNYSVQEYGPNTLAKLNSK